MYKKNQAKKKVFCRPVAIDWGRRTSALPNLSNRGRRAKDATSDRALASRAHSEVPTFLFYYYFWGGC